MKPKKTFKIRAWAKIAKEDFTEKSEYQIKDYKVGQIICNFSASIFFNRDYAYNINGKNPEHIKVVPIEITYKI